MTIAARRLSLALIALALLYLTGCASSGGYKVTAEMPIPAEIEPNVDFWRMVYGEWSRSQVAFHADEHLGAVYEVATLPGPILGSYTAEQKRFVRAKESEYRNRLASLERKLRSGARLSGRERELQEKLVDAGGRSAIYGAAERVRSCLLYTSDAADDLYTV